MGKVGRILVCILIIGLDISAGILGREAEVWQNKAKHLRLWIFECKKPSPKAYRYGLVAAAFLGIAHILANMPGGCTNSACCPNRKFAIICLVFTWIILAPGLSLLVLGAMANRKRPACGFKHPRHLLSNGGILCFVHGLFSVAYYYFATITEG